MQYHQRGAALVVVLALLANAVMVGVMGVQSGLVGERLGSNYRAAILAQMRAEVAALQAVELFETLAWQGAPVISEPQSVTWEAYVGHPLAIPVEEGGGQTTCFLMPVEYRGRAWVMSLGAVFLAAPNSNALLAQNSPIFIRLEQRSENELAEGTKATVIWQ